MLDSLQWVVENWRLCVASLALLPPIFAILHLLHFLIFVPEDDEEAEAQAAAEESKLTASPAAAAATRGKKKAKKLA